MTVPIWAILNQRLALRLPKGEVLFPSAIEVFRTAFQGQENIQGYHIGSPLEGLPHLSLSRLPAQVAVKVSGTVSGLAAELGVITDDGFSIVDSGADSIILGARWYPIVLDDMAATRQWLVEKKIELGSSVPIRTLIALRQAISPPFALLDEVGNTSLNAIQVVRDPPLPSGLIATLYPYQRDGVAFLNIVADQGIGCVLADEMGLGKTLQVIALLLGQKKQARFPNLVVAPATLLENWRREFEQFAPSVRVFVHSGIRRPGVADGLANYDIVITSYDLVVRDATLLQSMSWNVVALDEAQAIKNPSAQRTLSVKALERRVSVAITGTPLCICN